MDRHVHELGRKMRPDGYLASATDRLRPLLARRTCRTIACPAAGPMLLHPRGHVLPLLRTHRFSSAAALDSQDVRDVAGAGPLQVFHCRDDTLELFFFSVEKFK